jgi:hypothetical protein
VEERVGAGGMFPLPLGEGLRLAERSDAPADPKGGAKQPKGEGRAFAVRSDPHPFAFPIASLLDAQALSQREREA